MKRAKNKKSAKGNKQLGKLLMAIGLLGILYSILEPLFVIKGCFGYGIIDVLIYVVPIVILVIGYRVYNRNE